VIILPSSFNMILSSYLLYLLLLFPLVGFYATTITPPYKNNLKTTTTKPNQTKPTLLPNNKYYVFLYTFSFSLVLIDFLLLISTFSLLLFT